MDSGRIGSLRFVTRKGIEPSQTEVVVSHRVCRERIEFGDFADDEREPWRHAEGFATRRTHHGDVAFVEL